MSATDEKSSGTTLPAEGALAAWAERTIGGRVVSMEAMARWRPALELRP